MGIEIWVLLVLAAVLSLYLLPTLVGRREMMGSSRSEDRYSARLRILATTAPASEETCSGGHGHAQIFESRPEVKVMDRPDVRNVRALRVERELREVRASHLVGRSRRRRAAERRALVVLLLLAASVVMALVAALTRLPWWYALYAPVLVVPAFAYGRWATVRDRAEDLREVRRVAALRRQLRAAAGAEQAAGAVEPSRGPEAGALADAAKAEPGCRETPARAACREGREDREGRGQAAAAACSAATPARAAESEAVPLRAEQVRVTGRPRVVQRPQVAAAEKGLPPAGGAAGWAVPTPPPVELDASTPPQGWQPVKVPAPTYTLAARAPRRAVDPVLVDLEAAADVRVPVRPKAVRAYSLEGVGAEERAFQPIDLDAVLARRRAVGE